jgi:5'-3' exonuclease
MHLNIDNARMRDKVIEFGKQALLSKQLATIILDVPIELTRGIEAEDPRFQ